MKNAHFQNIISLVFASISVGWIMGNSVSPVVANVITSIMALFVAILTTLIGVERNDASKLSNVKIHILPFCLFCVFLAIGGSLGVYSKEHQWLGGNFDYTVLSDSSKTKIKHIDEIRRIGFLNDEISICQEVKSHYTNPKLLKKLLLVKSESDFRIDRSYLNGTSDSALIVHYAILVCENEN